MVAPRTESNRLPVKPATTTKVITSKSLIKNQAEAAMAVAPKSAPADPRSVMPPDVPDSNFLKVTLSLGFALEKKPISVAQVSAAAAATLAR